MMNTEWNLNILYQGIEDPNYEADIKRAEQVLAQLHSFLEKAGEKPELERVETILTLQEKATLLLSRLSGYLGLRQAVNTEDGAVMAQLNRIMRLTSAAAADSAAAQKLLGAVTDVEALAQDSSIIEAYKTLILQAKKECAHLLSDAEEAMVASMDMTGGSAWGQLQSYLTSTVPVSWKGEQVSLSEIRNLAYSADQTVRKEAYEAELACYERIADPIAFALNHIKNQVTMLAEKRGYASPLDMTLEESHMSRETLDAMMEAVKEYLPVFHRYMRKKGELLGHKNGMPWYELFAPIGSDNSKYSLTECRDILLECFGGFDRSMADMMSEAFSHEWIDFYPRNGKEGGAFCAELMEQKQSRILTNYDGTFGAVDTLAHELGHAFHNRQLENERPLNWNYPMPVAETASTFNEVFLGDWALKRAEPETKLALLENDLKSKVSCVVDIYSRYLFETAVFEQAQQQFLMTDDLSSLMLECQKAAYGDGLDPDYMHPYMWVCKSHYYISSLSFYNFPYTFGCLFAQGLYNLYRKQGDKFVANYKEMLRMTPVHTIEEDGAMLGVDLTKPDFWRESLQSIAEEIEEFCSLC